jgi:hypothetical protein
MYFLRACCAASFFFLPVPEGWIPAFEGSVLAAAIGASADEAQENILAAS